MAEPTRECLICLTPKARLHFGIDACRACACFFKRAQQAGRRYPCRTGKRDCLIDRAGGSMCRGCRFQKCTDSGMVYEARKPNVESTLVIKPKRESILNRIGKEHAACNELRRLQELKLVSQHKLERVPNTSEDVYLLNFGCVATSCNKAFPELWAFFLAAFPSMQGLPLKHQREFGRICISPFMLVVHMNNAKRIWGRIGRYMMSTVLMCFDTEHLEVWVPNEGGPLLNKLIGVVRSYVQDQKARMVPSFEKADLCEKEVMALLPLLLCESEIQLGELADEHRPLLQSIRRETMDDLQRMYTEEMGISEYSTRLGNLLSLCYTFREADVLFQEFFRMQVTVFDLFQTEMVLKDLLL